jgi:hypothetical protein
VRGAPPQSAAYFIDEWHSPFGRSLHRPGSLRGFLSARMCKREKRQHNLAPRGISLNRCASSSAVIPARAGTGRRAEMPDVGDEDMLSATNQHRSIRREPAEHLQHSSAAPSAQAVPGQVRREWTRRPMPMSRPYFKAETALQVLELIQDPEGGSTSSKWWRRWASNPRPETLRDRHLHP